MRILMLCRGINTPKPDSRLASFRLSVGFFAGRFAVGNFSRKRATNHREQVNAFSLRGRAVEIET